MQGNNSSCLNVLTIDSIDPPGRINAKVAGEIGIYDSWHISSYYTTSDDGLGFTYDNFDDEIELPTEYFLTLIHYSERGKWETLVENEDFRATIIIYYTHGGVPSETPTGECWIRKRSILPDSPLTQEEVNSILSYAIKKVIEDDKKAKKPSIFKYEKQEYPTLLPAIHILCQGYLACHCAYWRKLPSNLERDNPLLSIRQHLDEWFGLFERDETGKEISERARSHMRETEGSDYWQSVLGNTRKEFETNLAKDLKLLDLNPLPAELKKLTHAIYEIQDIEPKLVAQTFKVIDDILRRPVI